MRLTSFISFFKIKKAILYLGMVAKSKMDLVRLSNLSMKDVGKIFELAAEVEQNNYSGFLQNKTIVLFFPPSSIRTRVSFEKGIKLLGGQAILFPSDALDKKEDIRDVTRYLNNWSDCIVVRHNNISLIERMAGASFVPIINAMTDVNHPCEILSDLFTLSNLRANYLADNYLFVGAQSNIGLAWKEAADLFGLAFSQSCPRTYEMEGVAIEHDLKKAMLNKDIILTDSINHDNLKAFKNYQITASLMAIANKNALLNPCPPFFRGEEVSAEVMESKYFVGYEFKKSLLAVQQAIILYCMMNS
ncbi:peptide transporter [Desulfosporosinus sp. PR]|uniref:peptide transporter n=1 Tax=Candidatus Desulfosporosinus nitrosoreducens TaxID=3401928 RepID=UPI0027F22933|nr:peptide transporter [Desulfosporosinus sp. PR]MDQ7093970.1 peptide transporter [Desulfosporosinus sp. PR]